VDIDEEADGIELAPFEKLEEETAGVELGLGGELGSGAGTLGVHELTYLVCESVTTTFEDTVFV
jgi:hypothetical protein